MNYTLSVDIKAPIEKVASLLSDHEKMPLWMTDVTGYEYISGKPRHVGAKTRLNVNAPGVTEIIETILKVEFPKRFTTYYEVASGDFTADSKLEALGPDKTRYTLNHEFHFKGLMKLGSGLMKPAFVKHSEKLMQNFKRMVEQSK